MRKPNASKSRADTAGNAKKHQTHDNSEKGADTSSADTSSADTAAVNNRAVVEITEQSDCNTKATPRGGSGNFPKAYPHRRVDTAPGLVTGCQCSQRRQSGGQPKRGRNLPNGPVNDAGNSPAICDPDAYCDTEESPFGSEGRVGV